MEKHIESFLRKVSFAAITIATITLISLILQTPETCLPPDAHASMRFPRSSCDSFRRQHLPIEKKNHRLWSSKSWIGKVNTHIRFFQQLRDLGLLFNHSKVLCVSAGAGQEVMALNKLGVADVTGVELMDSPPLVSRADPHNLPFFDEAFDVVYTAHLAEALFPLRFVEEMERTVRDDGACVVLLEPCANEEIKEIVGLFRSSKFAGAVNVTFGASKMPRILMRKTRASA